MERLSEDLCLKIFCFLDQQSLATAQQAMIKSWFICNMLEVGNHGNWCCKVCRKWKVIASDNNLWSNLFNERWGAERAAFYAPVGSKSWKDVFAVQDRCDRVGLGLKIIREGRDYYLVHQGEIQRHLGSRRQRKGADEFIEEGSTVEEESGSGQGILDRILFFIGDLEVASTDAKRRRVL